MVGLDRFREYFANFSECYVLIGGAASYLMMDAAGIEFRATKDLDIVLCLETLNTDFVAVFWAFVKSGGYKNQQRSTGKKIYYRFTEPKSNDFPYMLELFSRSPDLMVLAEDSHLTPIPMTEKISSLSAILLDEEYYQFIHQHKTKIEGIQVVNQIALIPLKARAWLNLTGRREAGEKIDSKEIKKHKNDIFRVFQLLSLESRIQLPDIISEDMRRFINALLSEPDISLKPFGLKGLKVFDVINILQTVYKLP